MVEGWQNITSCSTQPSPTAHRTQYDWSRRIPAYIFFFISTTYQYSKIRKQKIRNMIWPNDFWVVYSMNGMKFFLRHYFFVFLKDIYFKHLCFASIFLGKVCFVRISTHFCVFFQIEPLRAVMLPDIFEVLFWRFLPFFIRKE